MPPKKKDTQDAPAQELTPDETQDAPPEEAPLVEEAPEPTPAPVQETDPEEGTNQDRIGRAVHVIDGRVDNVIVVRIDDTGKVHGYPITVGELVVVDDVTIGADWTYDGENFTAPEPVEDPLTEPIE